MNELSPAQATDDVEAAFRTVRPQGRGRGMIASCRTADPAIIRTEVSMLKCESYARLVPRFLAALRAIPGVIEAERGSDPESECLYFVILRKRVF